ncbi:hypothetical protein VNO77_20885 [Canavalia gladiata]|uniref:Uncharacterized protein n=1 Tax=Canavalia gladiata TaxID=3824 RepID=A0AAN9QLM1_CANGL
MTTPPKKSKLAIPERLWNFCIHYKLQIKHFLPTQTHGLFYYYDQFTGFFNMLHNKCASYNANMTLTVLGYEEELVVYVNSQLGGEGTFVIVSGF